jgi:hypothetical protein
VRRDEGTASREAATLRGFWDHAPGYQRLTYVVGVALVTAGLVQAGIWVLVGGSAAGPLSWRKPVTFGISFGLTTATLGWVATHLPARPRTGWVAACLLCTSTTLEVAWVSLQHARGVPSHFNTSTSLDYGLFVMGGVAIAVTVLVTAAMALAAFTRSTAAPPMAWAIRSGLVALLAAQAVGVWMVAHGLTLVDAGADPRTRSMTTYGEAGAMKVAHFVPMHAIQVFVVLAWLLSWSGLPQGRQVRLVALAVIGYAGMFGVVLARTVAGVGPFDLRSGSVAGFLVAVGLLAVPVVAAVASVGRRGATPSR